MKRKLIGACVSAALAVALLACVQAAAGELPSQSDPSAAGDQPGIRADAGGLTAEQSVALAAIGPGGDQAYGDASETAEIILLLTVSLTAVVLIVILASHAGL